MSDDRISILYLAPWIDYGGSDTSTIDWFRWIDKTRFVTSLITTQPSSNRRLCEVVPFAEEVWALPELMAGGEFARFIVEFVVSREIEIVHVMNSRIGFDLLPDLRALERPPKVVVQLHVEEPTRDGYVRYVATRYGNLVDAYSVSSAVVGEALVEYGVSEDDVVPIPTGIDVDYFAPDAVVPEPRLDSDRLHILFIARLVPQKDPLLMVDVARELRERGISFCIHVIGGGELEPEVRARVESLRLQDRILFEDPTHELRPWYAGADLLLMTSVFEGVPVIVYEALAMEVPIVAPDLPGIRELMGDAGGALVERRDHAADYAEAMVPLLESAEKRRHIGRAARNLVLERFSVQGMTSRHESLYEALLPGRIAGAARHEDPGWAMRFASRPSRGHPVVSVVVPCFNHGRPLRECVESILAQTYLKNSEIIVIDDASTEAHTISYLAELEGGDLVHVVRMPKNCGPSAARNRGIREASGRYIFPMDSDNLLLPDALERLVAQLQGAGEHVGFIYQNCQYFGNREDYFEAPVHNPWLLTQQNYIDTSALIDREVFDSGLGYAEDIVFGHEDWDFFLQLAAHGIHGEPARAKTLLYRKEGFTRSDLVEWTGAPFHPQLGERHPTLFSGDCVAAHGSDPSTRLKARWAPALSVVTITPIEVRSDVWETVAARLSLQRFQDFELLAAFDRDGAAVGSQPPIRRLASRPGETPAQRLSRALEAARGRHVLVTSRALPDLLADPGSLERLVRLLERAPRPTAFCLADVGGASRHPFAVIHGDDPDVAPHSIAFSRTRIADGELPLILDTDDPLGGLARWIHLRRHHLEWRHLHAAWAGRHIPSGRFAVATMVPEGTQAERSERSGRLSEAPLFPGRSAYIPRWSDTHNWVPACSAPLLRSQCFGFEEWTVTSTTAPPDGFQPEYYLGIVHLRSLQGTNRLTRDADLGYKTVAVGAEPTADDMAESLGYVEQVAFSMLEPLLLCRHIVTGAAIPICGETDPLRERVHWPPLSVLGYIDRYPIAPHQAPTSPPTRAWLRGLLRAVDLDARAHRVAFGTALALRCPWELGAALDRDPGTGIPVWIDSGGRLHTDKYAPTRLPYDLRRTLTWVGASARWIGFGQRKARAKTAARRGVEALRHTVTRPGMPAPMSHQREPDGWLLAEPGPDRYLLYSAIHPVTADQLVTRDPSEARELGYGPVHRLGYALASAPVTGTLQRPDLSVPWGSRFGAALTRSEDPIQGE